MCKKEEDFHKWLKLAYPKIELNNFQHHVVNLLYGEGGGIYKGGGVGVGKTFLINLLKEYEESLKDEGE